MSERKKRGRLSKFAAKMAMKAISSPRLSKLMNKVMDFAYRVYEEILYNQVKNGPIPQHVAIIPDGNRRWARMLGLNVEEGHNQGYVRLKQVLEWLLELGVKTITVYALSYENCLKRSPSELRNLFNLAKRGLEELCTADLVHRYRVKVKVIGRLDLVPRDVIEAVKRVEEVTKGYNDRFLNIAICYGGRQDIVDAVRAIAKAVSEGKLRPEEISEETIVKSLSTAHLGTLSDPDLVIRTSGEMRISNFLLWQIAYSELYFCDVYWPAFRRIDLLRAIRSYQQRERRFGK